MVPLILDPSAHSEESLRALLQEHTEGLEEIAVRLNDPKLPILEPLGIMAARDLLAAALALSRDAERARYDRDRLVLVVNLQVEALVAAIDLMKVHTALSKVPRAKPKG